MQFFWLSPLPSQETFNSLNTKVSTGKVCRVPRHRACTDRPSPAIWQLWVVWHLFCWQIVTLSQRRGSCSHPWSLLSSSENPWDQILALPVLGQKLTARSPHFLETFYPVGYWVRWDVVVPAKPLAVIYNFLCIYNSVFMDWGTQPCISPSAGTDPTPKAAESTFYGFLFPVT